MKKNMDMDKNKEKKNFFFLISKSIDVKVQVPHEGFLGNVSISGEGK